MQVHHIVPAFNFPGSKRSSLFISASRFRLLALGSVNTESLIRPNSRPLNKRWQWPNSCRNNDADACDERLVSQGGTRTTRQKVYDL